MDLGPGGRVHNQIGLVGELANVCDDVGFGVLLLDRPRVVRAFDKRGVYLGVLRAWLRLQGWW